MSALIGLKVRLPHGWSQISEQTSSSAGALRPAAANASDAAHDAGRGELGGGLHDAAADRAGPHHVDIRDANPSVLRS
jgi:hypothetical protein